MLYETNILIERLKETLNNNLIDHEELFNLAYEKYKEDYAKYVEEFASKVKQGDFKTVFNPPTKPISYAKKYKDVLSQLDFSSDDVIKLSDREFRNYILDEWDFSSAFYSAFTSVTGYQVGQEMDGVSVSNFRKLTGHLSQ